MRFYPELLELFGATLIIIGLALWTVPAALITAGLFLVVAAAAVPGSDRAAPSRTGTGRRPRRVA